LSSGVLEKNLERNKNTGGKTLDWVALLDERANPVGWAPVDGF